MLLVTIPLNSLAGNPMGLHCFEEQLLDTVFPHPKLSEMMKECVLVAYGRGLNTSI